MTKTPWNKNKAVGQKKGFTVEEVELIRRCLIASNKTMELALLNVALDTHLKAKSITVLKVSNIMDYKGNIFDHILNRQITSETKEWLFKWINEAGKHQGDWLFNPRLKGGGYKTTTLTRSTYANIIKEWCVKYLEIDPKNYSTESLRNSKFK